MEQSTSKEVSDCWCFHASIPKELLALIPEVDRGKACVCSRCVTNFKATLPS
ncbi:cysteine-rich CWC family protein [Paenibacillus sp. GSMTC-2017]|uniref:cysteine-rich CWC family protein n=1 Tax=Paenibacillus sp. GSMTC-2017 TaxID=2794350 RepID=UPI0018D986A5|nr:cysteine-rich CWC family protein [Paenibacillus sp. GSMTC-2017]MBH5317446.1 cysteine-rich CWC family protein [Paenibacillus sp. GSMTC-2017]